MSSKKRALEKLESNQRAMAALGCVVGISGARLSESVEQAQIMGRQSFAWAGAVDGWPGSNFYAVLWHLSRPTEEQARARIFAVAGGPDTRYKMDRQNCGWFEDVWDRDGDGSDCSDLIAYGIGRRKAGGADWLNSKGQQNWTHTGSIVHDATHKQELFRLLDKPEPMCIFAYVDKDGGQGHCGFVTDIDKDGTLHGIDCSSSQGRKGDAVTWRNLDWTRRKIESRGLIYCKPVNW